ncbi:MAG: aldehyde dehydrogenase family protein [Flavobacteriales bacterium]
MEALKTQVEEVFALQRDYFLNTLKSAPISVRKNKLKRLKKWIVSSQDAIIEALQKDFGKPAFETKMTEIYPVMSAIKHTISHMDGWARDESKEASMAFLFTRSKVVKEPKGVSLIISPWNYPFILAVDPLISAVAAGCTAIIKPSENTPHTSQLIENMVKEVFEEKEVAVFQGDAEVAKHLQSLKFNHVFFTGSPAVGKLVMKAAAEHLTSVTLELGGTNPAVVDETAQLKDAAEKILWAKTMNAGQTCISVNEIYVHESVKDKLIQAFGDAQKKLFPDGISIGENMACIVNQNHFERVSRLLESAKKDGGTVVFGGKIEADKRWIGATLLDNVPKESAIKQEEIFGPLVTLTSYTDLNAVISQINAQPIPLAAYIFTKSRTSRNTFLNGVQAGTTCVNETTIQFAHPDLPFGGHGNSGVGKGHGYYGFLEFTNQRSELKQRTGFTSAKLIYPPYDRKWKQKLADLFIRWF